MRRTFPFHDLSNDEFESLVASICLHVLGTGTVVFATGKDGGRDASFTGSAQKFPSLGSPLAGKFVIQSKHTSNPAASCSDAEFARLLNDEKSKLEKLVAGDGVDHYIVCTNRKKPASSTIEKEKALLGVGVKTAHIIGLEQLRIWLTDHPQVWSNLGFDRFEAPFRLQVADLTEVIREFHNAVGDGSKETASGDFQYIAKPEKNKINKLSEVYFEEIRTRSMPYFQEIEQFLKNPRNHEFKDMYEDTADEIRRKLIAAAPPFPSFDAALTSIIEAVTQNNDLLKRRRRFAAIFLHYMYYTCDIGQHA